MQSLLESPSREVCFLAKVTVADKASVTSENFKYVKRLHWPQASAVWCSTDQGCTGQAVSASGAAVGLLSSLLSHRREKYRSQEDTARVKAMLVSLSTTPKKMT